jgi:hypothetical protein
VNIGNGLHMYSGRSSAENVHVIWNPSTCTCETDTSESNDGGERVRVSASFPALYCSVF